jgi:hypothetical protein
VEQNIIILQLFIQSFGGVQEWKNVSQRSTAVSSDILGFQIS